MSGVAHRCMGNIADSATFMPQVSLLREQFVSSMVWWGIAG